MSRHALLQPSKGRCYARREDGNIPPGKAGAWIPRAAVRRSSRTEIEGIAAASGASKSARRANASISLGSFADMVLALGSTARQDRQALPAKACGGSPGIDDGRGEVERGFEAAMVL